jgi:hypothetical protein
MQKTTIGAGINPTILSKNVNTDMSRCMIREKSTIHFILAQRPQSPPFKTPLRVSRHTSPILTARGDRADEF